MKRLANKLWILIFVSGLSACSLPIRVIPIPFNPIVVTIVVPVPGSRTLTPGSNSTCAYVQSVHLQLKLSNQMKTALEKTGFTGVKVDAMAYGEDCVDQNGQRESFSPQETDFSISIKVASLDNRKSLGDQLVTILQVWNRFPPGIAPGTEWGNMQLNFFTGEGKNLAISFTHSQAMDAQNAHPGGEELLDILSNP